MLPIAVGVNVLQQAIEIYVNTGHKALMPGVSCHVLLAPRGPPAGAGLSGLTRF